MITVEFLGPINIEDMQVDVSSLGELSSLLLENKELASWLSSSAVAVNNTMVNDATMLLNDGDKVSILPPVCGG